MAHRFNLSVRALNDIESAARRIALGSLPAAKRWYVALMNQIDQLCENPNRYPLADEAGDFGVEVREMSFGKRRGIYRVFFRLEEDVVLVLRVWHAAQRPLRLEDL